MQEEFSQTDEPNKTNDIPSTILLVQGDIGEMGVLAVILCRKLSRN